MSSVSLIHCSSYEKTMVEDAVRRAVAPFGGISSLVKPGDRVLLKANLLAAYPPERRITTDPAVVRAAARLVLEAGGRPVIADSPALEPFRRVAARSGMLQVAEELGIEAVALDRPKPVALAPGSLFQHLEIAALAREADVVINLPKLKTHSQMLLTLGVKNLFGTVVGQRKAEWHFMAGIERDAFARLLLDIYRTVSPALTILDGIWGMEGHGPANGIPRKLNLIAAAADTVALDVAVAHLLDVSLNSFPLYRVARKGPYGETDIGKMIFHGDSPARFRVPDFQIPKLDSMGVLGVLPPVFDRLTRRFLVSKPVRTPGSCTSCLKCAEICPAKAIHAAKGDIVFDYDACIRCYCCQEICPQDSIRFQRGPLVHLLTRFNR